MRALSSNQLDDASRALSAAMAASGYAQASTWAVNYGPRLINEIKRLRTIVRVNALRNGASHADIDRVLDEGAAE